MCAKWIIVLAVTALVASPLPKEVWRDNDILAAHVFPQGYETGHSWVSPLYLENKTSLMGFGHNARLVVHTSDHNGIDYLGLIRLIWRPLDDLRIGRAAGCRVYLPLFRFAREDGKGILVSQSPKGDARIVGNIWFATKIALPLHRLREDFVSPLREVRRESYFNFVGGKPPIVFKGDGKDEGESSASVEGKRIDDGGESYADRSSLRLYQSLRSLKLLCCEVGKSFRGTRLLISSDGEIVRLPSLLGQLRELLLIQTDKLGGLLRTRLHLPQLALHYAQLPSVNTGSNNADDGKHYLAAEVENFKPVQFPSNLLRGGLCIGGSVLSLCCYWWAILWGRWWYWTRRELRVRLFVGAFTFVVFVWLFCQGVNLLSLEAI